jgi:hypothetical protein
VSRLAIRGLSSLGGGGGAEPRSGGSGSADALRPLRGCVDVPDGVDVRGALVRGSLVARGPVGAGDASDGGRGGVGNAAPVDVGVEGFDGVDPGVDDVGVEDAGVEAADALVVGETGVVVAGPVGDVDGDDASAGVLASPDVAALPGVDSIAGGVLSPGLADDAVGDGASLGAALVGVDDGVDAVDGLDGSGDDVVVDAVVVTGFLPRIELNANLPLSV